jgi:hypothetical protein
MTVIDMSIINTWASSEDDEVWALVPEIDHVVDEKRFFIDGR